MTAKRKPLRHKVVEINTTNTYKAYRTRVEIKLKMQQSSNDESNILQVFSVQHFPPSNYPPKKNLH